MSLQTFLFGVGGVLLSATLVLFAATIRIDRGLRTLIPASTERRWREELIRDIRQYRPDFAELEVLDVSLTPIRWRRDYHGVEGIRLLERFFFAVCGTAISASLAVMAIGSALR